MQTKIIKKIKMTLKKINLKLTGALKSIIEIYLDAKIKDENIKYS